MASKLLEQLKIDLSNTEKILQAQSHKSPVKKTLTNSGTFPEKRRPWNYGPKCSTSNLAFGNENFGVRPSPICTRSRTRSRSRSVTRTLSPPLQSLPKKVLSSPSKNVVHKQTINASDKQTIVEVSVKTKHQSRDRKRPVVQPVLTDDLLANKFANVGISSQGSKNCSSSCVNPDPLSHVRKEPSWSNILSLNPSHSVIPDGYSNKRSCDVLTDPHVNRKLKCYPNHGTKLPDHQKSKEVHNQHDGDGNILINVDPYRKLNFLIKELRGNSLNDPNLRRIVLDIEEAVANLPSPENVESPVASLTSKITGVHPTVQKQCNDSPTRLPNMVPPRDALDCRKQNSPTEPNLFRLSPSPLPSEQHSPCRNTNTSKQDSGALIQNFLKILNTALQPTSPEGKHRSKKDHLKDDRLMLFKEQLDGACRILEESCKRMEEDCEKLMKDKAELEKILRDKEKKLQSAISFTQKLEAENEEMQGNLQSATLEIQKVREELATKSRNNEHEENLKKYQSKLDELMEENKKQAIELGMSRLEKEKLSVLLTSSEKEREKLVQEIKAIQATVVEQLANIHSLSDHNKTLTQLDEMMRPFSKQSLLSDITIEEKIFDGRELPNLKFENLNPVHSSPNSSACTSELYTSWRRLSTITSEEESTKRMGRSRGTHSKKRKEKTSEKAKSRQSAVGDIFTELKNKSSASAFVSLPSPPREIGLSFSGISHLTDESTHGSMTISDDSQSDTASTV